MLSCYLPWPNVGGRDKIVANPLNTTLAKIVHLSNLVVGQVFYTLEIWSEIPVSKLHYHSSPLTLLKLNL